MNTKKKTEINVEEAREKLVSILFRMQRQATKRDELKKLLEDDFDEHKAEYENGIETPLGVLFRRPRGYDVLAKPSVNAEDRAENE